MTWKTNPPATQREFDEQLVLAHLLCAPQANAWELSGLDAALFQIPNHRAIAEALCAVRDSGRRVHWRRVRAMVRPGAKQARALVEPLRCRAGASFGLTAAISRLHHTSRRSA